MLRIESSHSLWLFDPERHRFRRLPHGTDPDAPALDADWEPYHDLEVDEATGSFTVVLNEDRTRILRAWRRGVASGEGDTAEVRVAQATADLATPPDATAELPLARPETGESGRPA